MWLIVRTPKNFSLFCNIGLNSFHVFGIGSYSKINIYPSYIVHNPIVFTTTEIQEEIQ